MRGMQNTAAGRGVFIREGREGLGLSLKQAAALWEIDKAALSRMESGRQSNPGANTLLKLSRGLGVTVDELLRAGDSPREETGLRRTGVAAPRKAIETTS